MEKANRTACRTQLTKLIKSAEEALKTEPNKIDKLEVFKVRILEARNKLSNANEKLLKTMDGSDETVFNAEYVSILEYDDAAIAIMAELEVTIRKSLPAVPAVEPVERTQVQGDNEAQRNLKKSVRLPKLELIKFSGNPQQWVSFWEQYKTAIHENDELDETAKFTYLKTVLTGKAASTVNGLTTTHACYEDAIGLLKNEFGNPEKLIDTYIQQLLLLSSVNNKGDVLGLRKLYNTTTTITKSLQSLGISPNQYGMMLKSVILKAIPYYMRIDFNKQILSSKVDSSLSETGSAASSESHTSQISYEQQITKLLSFLKIEIDSVEQAQSVSNDAKKAYKNNEYKPSSRGQKLDNDICTAQGLLTLSKDCCLFCKNKDHTTKNCQNTSMNINEKKSILKNNSCCFRCTLPNHRSKDCRTRDIVCKKCKGRHVTVLCDPHYKGQIKNNETDKTQTALANFAGGPIDNVYLQTACVYVKSSISENENDILIRAIIDGGSQLTFIKQCLSRELNLPITGTHKISICSFGSSKQGVAKLCNKVEVLLKGQFSNEVVKINAIEVPEICFDSIKPPNQNDQLIKNFAVNHQLADMGMKTLQKQGISLLIGADNYWAIVNSETKYLSDNLAAVNTRLGWTIHGTGTSNFNGTDFSVNFSIATILHVQSMDNNTDINNFDRNEPDLKLFWDLETIGINAETKTVNNFTEDFIKNNVKIANNRYEVCLPWQNDKHLDANYEGALRRTKNLANKLCQNNKLLEYDKAVREFVKTECAELVDEQEILSDERYYLPHRPVYRYDKETTQVRVVFDASAHAPGMPSLNEKLLPGDNLIPDLQKILLAFRIGCVGLIADIEKAFLQIALKKEDRDFHRFLWFKDPIKEEITSVNQLPELKAFRMCRVTFGVTTSPFLLAATLRKHLVSQADQEFGQRLLDSFYVDDFVLAVGSTKEAKVTYERAKDTMAEANMNLRKWSSNDPELTKIFSGNLEQEKILNTIDKKKVLGVAWYTVTDQLKVDLHNILNDAVHTKVPTKRLVLQTIARVFDPLGFLGPFTITIKILLQKIWILKLKWDGPLPNEEASKWMIWIHDLTNLKDYCIPRCVISSNDMLVELHIFADASPHAYGVVAYLKCVSTCACTFLMAKNRVAPLNHALTLPKLELTAALCASRLQKFILTNTNLKLKNVFLWSDSKITLYWIEGKQNKWKPFVQNRVNEIRSLTENVTWKFCPGNDNPADLVTRGISSAKFLKESERWLGGPTWLSLDEENWPKEEIEDAATDKLTSLITGSYEESSEKLEELQPIFDLEQYSSYEKALRITALVYRFVNNTKKNTTKRTESLTTEEMENAEYYWIKSVQQKHFSEEISSLRKGKEIGKRSSVLNLNPFLDENQVLRLGGRLQNAELTFNEKHPIIIPKGSNLAIKIIWQAHEESLHSGINSTLTTVRKKYWIIQARQKIKSTISRCIKCKKLKGKPGNEPFAPLPRDRITKAQPFSVTGIDFAGPLYVTMDGKKTKVYIMLFTCAVIRAVHLELVNNLTTESCLLGIRRFIARRGVPNTIYSDNAKTFKRANLEIKELSTLLEHEEVQDLARKKRIQWKFSIERGSWWGGFWERLVRTVKTCLKIALGRSFLNSEQLKTLLYEVEATVNSRPLTYIDNDATNLFILTPSKFLIGEKDFGFSMNLKSSEIKRNTILQTWKERESSLTRFWKIWLRDYLQQLQSAHERHATKSSAIKIGDVAILHDQDRPRLMWKLVRVLETFQGRDGRTRACELITSDGTKLKRPVQLLYPLEVREFCAGEDVVKNASSGVNL